AARPASASPRGSTRAAPRRRRRRRSGRRSPRGLCRPPCLARCLHCSLAARLGDHARREQRLDAVFVVSELTADLDGVLAEKRRRVEQPPLLTLLELDRLPENAQRSERWVANLFHHAER